MGLIVAGTILVGVSLLLFYLEKRGIVSDDLGYVMVFGSLMLFLGVFMFLFGVDFLTYVLVRLILLKIKTLNRIG